MSSVDSSSSLAPALSVAIPAQEQRYPLYIATDLLPRAGAELAAWVPAGCKVLILSDATVSSLYAAPLQRSLKAAGFQVFSYTVPEGEGAKSLEVAQQVYAFALEIGLSRRDVMLALGGGVVGDLTGFCAATFFRGVPFVQVPTTLLAQVDSSVGGKVAVNFQTAKNGVGAFYQPLAVFADTQTLASLPERQRKAGLAEVVKYSLIEKTCAGSEGLFDLLSRHADTLCHWDDALADVLPEIVRQCCRIKAVVVSQDERETSGMRSFLNLGHTFAHAYEEITGYSSLLHGEAVAMGMAKACQLAERLGLFQERQRVEGLMQALGLPLHPPAGLEPLRLLRLMHHDKKASGGVIRLVLPVGSLGEACLKDDVSEQTLLALLAEA